MTRGTTLVAVVTYGLASRNAKGDTKSHDFLLRHSQGVQGTSPNSVRAFCPTFAFAKTLLLAQLITNRRHFENLIQVVAEDDNFSCRGGSTALASLYTWTLYLRTFVLSRKSSQVSRPSSCRSSSRPSRARPSPSKSNLLIPSTMSSPRSRVSLEDGCFRRYSLVIWAETDAAISCRQGRHSARPAAAHLRGQAARRRPDALGLQHPEGVDAPPGPPSPRRGQEAKEEGLHDTEEDQAQAEEDQAGRLEVLQGRWRRED